MSATDEIGRRFGQAKVFHFSFLNQVLHRAGYVFDGHIGVRAVLVEKINSLYPQSLERGFSHALDLFGPTIQAGSGAWPPVAIVFEAELGGDHHFIAKRLQRFAHQVFVGERPVDFRRIEKRDTPVHCCVKEIDHILPGADGGIPKSHPHAAKPKGRNFQITVAKLTCLHCFPPVG